MKKIIVTLIFSNLVLFHNFCKAQAYKLETFSGSVGAEVLFTETKLSAINKTGAGATIKAEYVFAKHASATISSGYYFLPGKNVLSAKTAAISAIPVKAGVRYYLGNFYGAGEAGGIFFMGNNRKSGLAYSFGLGDKFKLGRNIFDIGLRHEGWSTPDGSLAIIGLRIGYEFALAQKEESNMPSL